MSLCVSVCICVCTRSCIYTGSAISMAPSPSVSHRTGKNKTQVLVQTPTRNYTSSDYEALLHDLGLHESVMIYRHVFPQYLATLVPPGVSYEGGGGCV